MFDDPADETTAFRNLKISGKFVVKKVADTPGVQCETTSFSTRHVNPAIEVQQKTGKDYEIEVMYSMESVASDPKHEEQDRSFCRYMRANPRKVWCGCQYLCCAVFFVLSFVVCLTGSILMMATAFGKNLKVSYALKVI